MRKRYDLPPATGSFDDITLDGRRKNKRSIHSIPFYAGLAIFALLAGLYWTVYLLDGILPTPLSLADEKSHPEAFITERARHDLKLLTEFGPRVVGGYENEVLTVDYLKREIGFITQQAHSSQKIELDIQTVTGSHYLIIAPSGAILAYSNIQNVIVKLYARNSSSTNSVLVNAHFDSVPTSPGGSDDGINCAVMLEVLRKLSRKPERPLNNVIFLFNGAEETVLQAAHGFITQHKWANESKVVVNLEATGAGGKIILFQAGPGASWLMNYYNRVPHPYGQAAGEEIFQSGLIPSDTDYRIFRDYGGLVGFDMAFFKSGYRYHTKYDDYAHIPQGSFQHVGDNTLSLVGGLANAPELANPKSRTDKIVYYDVIGLFMVSYTQSLGNVMNYVAVAMSLAMFFVSIHGFNLGYTKQTLKYLAVTFGAIVGGWVIAFAFVALTALFVDAVGYSMSWYGNPWLILGLFVTPTVALSGCLTPFINHLNLNTNVKAHIQAHAVRLIWTSILFIGTVFNIRTTYAILIPVSFNTAAFIVIYVFRLQHTRRAWQIVYLIFNLIPMTYLMYNALTSLALFVPMTGRIGSNLHPDLIIGLMSVLFTILVTSPLVALVSLIHDFKYFLAVLGAVFVVNLVLVFTPLGFPYSGDLDHPTAERFWIIHTRRVFHAEDGSEIRRDSGYFLLNMDRNSPSKVKPYVKDLSKAKSLNDDCDKYLLCGLPLVHSKMMQIMRFSTWVPAGQPILPEATTLQVVSKVNLSPTLLRYTLLATGPDRLGLYISPKLNMKISHISLADKQPPENTITMVNNRPVYFILHIYGSKATPLQFTVDVEVPSNYTGGATCEVAVSGIFVHDNTHQRVPHYENFLKQFPDWADLTAWLGSYESWWI